MTDDGELSSIMLGGAVGGKKKYYYCLQKGFLEETVSSIIIFIQFQKLRNESHISLAFQLVVPG